MPTQSVSILLFNPEKQEVLLQKREDFRVWALPGGRIETGETWQEAAIREAYEETGYRITIKRLVGKYSRPQMPNGGDLTFAVLGEITDHPADVFGWETVALQWFPVSALPATLLRFGRIYITDALVEQAEPVRRTLYIPFYQVWLLRLLFGLRSLRNRLLKRP